MELEDLEKRLKLFCEDRYQSALEIDELTVMPGHAGFAYGFRVSTESKQESWFIRFPPPNVNWVGTACLLYTSPSPRDLSTSRMPSSA